MARAFAMYTRCSVLPVAGSRASTRSCSGVSGVSDAAPRSASLMMTSTYSRYAESTRSVCAARSYVDAEKHGCARPVHTGTGAELALSLTTAERSSHAAGP